MEGQSQVPVKKRTQRSITKVWSVSPLWCPIFPLWLQLGAQHSTLHAPSPAVGRPPFPSLSVSRTLLIHSAPSPSAPSQCQALCQGAQSGSAIESALGSHSSDSEKHNMGVQRAWVG